MQCPYQYLSIMIKSVGINTRVLKVNKQLQRLACLIHDDYLQQSKTKQALKQLHSEFSSQDSINFGNIQNYMTHSKGFNCGKGTSDGKESDVFEQTEKCLPQQPGVIKRYKIQELGPETQPIMAINQSRLIDRTLKKFRPLQSQGKKKKQNAKQKIKQFSKLKNSKSQNKIVINYKIDINKKIFNNHNYNNNNYNNNSNNNYNKKYQKDIKKYTNPHNNGNNLGKSIITKKMKPPLKPNIQNRLNQSLKMHINLKKYVNKIVDLNIQKQQCHKQAQYLKSVMKIQQQQILQQIIKCIQMTTEEAGIIVFMAKIIINFFNQFFSQKMIYSDQCSCQQLLAVLKKKKFLIKYMLKLPQILKTDSTLCEQRSKKLFQNKHFIDHRIQSIHKSLQNDPLYIFISCLNDYISFLLNNNVVKQTKRNMLPIQFHSQRSGKAKNNSGNHHGVVNTSNINKQVTQGEIQQKERQYDSDRKSERKGRKDGGKGISNYQTFTNINGNNQKNFGSNKTALKSINVHSMFSPKGKIMKDFNSHIKIHHFK